jgi:periplasmic protein TonB
MPRLPVAAVHTVPWRRRVPTLLLATLLHALIILVFLRGLTLSGHALLETPMLVSIVTPPPSSAPLPPRLPAPKLPQAPPIPPLIAPAVQFPNVITTAAPRVAAAPKVHVRPSVPAATGIVPGDKGPTYISGPLDADEYYPMAARMNFAQGHVWTRVCVYSTGDIASVAVLQTSGDAQLDQAALTVAKQTRWKPAMAQGKPVARCSPFRVDFSLTQGPLVIGGISDTK